MARLGVLRFALMGLWILHVQADFNDDLATKINGKAVFCHIFVLRNENVLKWF